MSVVCVHSTQTLVLSHLALMGLHKGSMGAAEVSRPKNESQPPKTINTQTINEENLHLPITNLQSHPHIPHTYCPISAHTPECWGTAWASKRFKRRFLLFFTQSQRMYGEEAGNVGQPFGRMRFGPAVDQYNTHPLPPPTQIPAAGGGSEGVAEHEQPVVIALKQWAVFVFSR